MNHEDVSMAVLRSRCAQMKIDESRVLTILDRLRPKLDEARTKLQEWKIMPKDMLYAFDMSGIMKEGRKPDYIHMYPCPAPSIVAWSGMFTKILNSQMSNLAYAEQLSLKMINYMVYTECVYTNLVNHLCYVLVNTKDPQYPKKWKCKTNMESIARNCALKVKVEFLRLNLPDIPDELSITEACNIDLRNMIAHGNFAGNPPPAPHPRQPKLKHQSMSAPVYVRRQSNQVWEWDGEPVDLDAVYEEMLNVTRIWHAALWHYWDIAYGVWRLFPEPWQTQTGARYPPDWSCEQTMW